MHPHNPPAQTPSFRRLPIAAAIARQVAAASLLLPGLALANPSGGVVVGGSANISTPSANQTLINQSSNAAVINWQQFDIGGNQMVQFVMPSSSSVVLNRIIGGSPAEIFGDLSANGRVFLIDPQGILFGRTASLDVGGLVASTMNISNQDFMSGNYVFSSGGGSGSGSGVINAGHISTADGGFVVLAGDYVKNSGVIQARMGQVVLASGSAMTMDLNGNGLISFAVNQATLAQKAGVDNTGQILADGGRVLMTADTARSLVSSAVNNSGLIQAQGIANHDGEIELTASGGDVSDSGTLDVSNAGGAGGTVQISSDKNIDLQDGAQILANGSQGGSVSIVADGTLNTRAGSTISALGSQGPGGYTELSGHGSLFMRGAVNLGHGGTLAIDPTNLTIGAGTGASNSATVYQNTIQSELQSGTNVQLVASNSIATSGALNNGLLDGSNNGTGGSLTIGIGTLGDSGNFVQGANGTINLGGNGIKIDGDLTIDSGYTTGSITAGNLTAGSINLNASGAAAGSTDVSVGNLVANASASEGGQVNVSAYNAGSLQIGSASGTTIDLYAADGSITATGGLSSIPTGQNGAGVFISGSNGAVTVEGPISATSTTSSAYVSINGSSINLQGVTVSGVGSASFYASAANAINIGGAVKVSATLAQSSYGSAGNQTIEKYGQAVISLSADNGSSDPVTPDTSTIATNGLSASGPNASISVSGGTLTLNNAANGAPAVSVNATGAYYSSSADGVNQVTSNFGFGLAQLSSDNGNGPGSAGITSGTIAVSGPAAVVAIASNSDVTVNGDITATSSNTMGIGGSTGAAAAGYTVLGDAGLLPAFGQFDSSIRPHCCDNGIAVEPYKLPPILLDSGSLQWGNADIAISGYSTSSNGAATNYAGNVSISGKVSANGLGDARFNVDATSLSVGGAVTVTAGQVSLMGAQQSFVTTGSSSDGGALGYTATRTISNGAGGAATYGRANTDIELSGGGNVSLGSLTVQGFSDAGASINGAGTVVVAGNVAVDGNLGGTAAVYDESVSFANTNGGTGIDTSQTYDTHLVGGETTFGVNFDNGGIGVAPATSFSAAGLQLNGYGSVGIAINAASISAGTVSLTQQAGSYASNDPTRTPTAFSVTDPGAVLVFEASEGSSSSQALSISVNAVGPAALGLDTTVTGAFDVSAESLSDAVPAGIINNKGPLQQGTPDALASGSLFPAVSTSGIDVSAGSASLSLGADSTLAQLQLSTSGALSLDANGFTINSGTLSFAAGGNASFSNAVFNDTGTNPLQILSGGTLNLSGVTIGPGTVALGGNSGVSISGSSIDGTTVSIGSSAGSVAIGGSTLGGQDLGITAATGAALTGDTVNFTQAVAIGSNAGQTLIDSNLSTAGTLDVVGGSVSTQNLSGGNVTVAAAGGGISTGSITGTASVTVESTGGTVDIGAVTAPAISSTIAGGNATFGDLNSTGTIELVQDSGNLATGNITASQFTSAVDTGNEQVGNVSVNGSNLFFGLGDVAGQALQIGNISYSGSTPLSFSYTNASLTVGNVSTGGSLDVALTNGKLVAGSISAGSGSINLGSTNNSISTAALSAPGNITVTAGGAVNVSGVTTLGNSSNNGALQVSGSSVQMGDIVNDSPLVSTGTANDMHITATGGDIALGNVGTAGVGTVALTLSAGSGSISTGNISLEVVNASSSGNISLGTLSLESLTPGEAGASNLTSGAGSVTTGGIVSNHALDVSGQTGISVGDVAVTGGLQLSSGAGGIVTGNLSDSGGGVGTSAAGTTQVGSVTADGDIDLATTAGNLGTGSLTANGSAITVTDSAAGGNVTVGTLSGGTGALSSVDLSAGGSLTTASPGTSITAGSITLNAGSGALSFGALTATAGNLSVSNSGGTVSVGNLSATGNVDLGASGALSAGNIGAAGLSSNVGGGNEQVGNLDITGNTLNFTLGDVSGQTLQIGNIIDSGGSPLSFAYNNAGLTVGNVGAAGFSAVLGSGNLSAGSINTGAGNITLTAGKGSLAFGDLAGGNIALSTGQALSLGNDTIDASGSFTLAAGNTSLDGVVIDAGSATITSNGTLSLSGSQVDAAAVTLNGSGGITINDNSLIGQSSDSGGVRSHLPANSSVSLSGGNILIDNSTVQAQQLSINGGNIQLADGSVLDGGIVTLSGSGLINATGGASTINAGGLAVSGNVIDLSNAGISVGTSTVSLGSDPTLLQEIQAKDPGLLPASSGPNAAFSAAGGVTLGTLSIAGGYLFIQAPTLSLPALSGNSNMFVDYLPSNPAAALNVNLSQQPSGITTLVFGGTPQTGQINIGNGSQNFTINSGVNLVFASSGATYYPDSISSNATVLVLGSSVLETPAPTVQLADVPLVPTDYTVDAPATGVLAYSGDQGDVNASGVNGANKGLIDVESGGKAGLSCGIGGAQ